VLLKTPSCLTSSISLYFFRRPLRATSAWVTAAASLHTLFAPVVSKCGGGAPAHTTSAGPWRIARWKSLGCIVERSGVTPSTRPELDFWYGSS
jgi:hypothetical protein